MQTRAAEDLVYKHKANALFPGALIKDRFKLDTAKLYSCLKLSIRLAGNSDFVAGKKSKNVL